MCIHIHVQNIDVYKRQALIFCLIITAGVCVFAAPLMTIFVDPSETEIIAIGVQYLRIEGACYCGIGCLFLLYGYYRAVNRAEISLVLTVISLGLRVALAYILSPFLGETGIWLAIPIGWVMADLAGLLGMRRKPATDHSRSNT